MAKFARVGLALGLGVALTACGGEQLTQEATVIARVGDRSISLDEFETWLSERPGAERRATRAGGAREELDRLIELVVVEEESRRRGIDQDPDYLGRRATIRARADLQERELLRRMLYERIVDSTAVSEDELRARYDEVKDRLMTSRIHLRQIVVSDREMALSVRERVLGGEEFPALASEVNVDASLRERAGDLGPMLRTEVPAVLRIAAFGLTEEGEVSAPFPIGERWSLLQLVARETAVQRDFASARPSLEQELQGTRAAAEFQRLVAERREELGVEIDEALLARLGPPAPRRLPTRRVRREVSGARTSSGEPRPRQGGGS